MTNAAKTDFYSLLYNSLHAIYVYVYDNIFICKHYIL
jgi:hypothetical protein